ncbi:NUDIX domain-containing protein [Rhodoferax sp.]|uniref:NUDIX hydrolase n=1 Tax=Rhodoferax sp. TaxID=50421 RepID=UPI002ACDD454|nr:NUDIX domain-containing protein [Rhodoferax sp.]MDZ7919715.1 NUDIX domain-containing protein [Rhodoferax sp.]
MQDMLEAASGAPRDASTVVLLRDSPQGLEVFLMKRSGLSDTFGETYVFPGGKLDAHDSHPGALASLNEPAAALAHRLGEPELHPDNAAALYVAALRELFEEAGVLMSPTAHRPAGVSATDWQAWLASPDANLDATALVPWSRWITPKMAALSKKRFDTRFFLALAPADQVASHDNYETTASTWLAPKEALHRYHRGEIEMAPPQIMSLGHLARYTTAAEALAAARAQLPPCICPENFEEDGMVVLSYPGDPRHSVPARALPGPTRMVVRNKRFVPVDGLESLWA